MCYLRASVGGRGRVVWWLRCLTSLLLVAKAPGFAAAAVGRDSPTKGEADFSRDVLPIFSDNCFKCHGPDEKARKAKLRLDTKEGTFRSKDGVTVIVPGDSKKSELVRRISNTDPDDVMPPPKSNRKLTAKQIELLTRWVDQGAKWGLHWAFVPPQRPPIPKIKNTRWPRNPIDYFIVSRLEKEGLAPSPEARKERWLRRVSLDLTGLPPTAPEIDAFLADRSPN